MVKKCLFFIFLGIVAAGSIHADSEKESASLLQEAQDFVETCKQQGITEEQVKNALAEQLEQVALCMGSSAEEYEVDGDTCSQKVAKTILACIAAGAFLYSMYLILTKIFKVKIEYGTTPTGWGPFRFRLGS